VDSCWRSATDLVVPVLTATITIIGSFLPLVILTGAIGELSGHFLLRCNSSFIIVIVAMFLTPLLCISSSKGTEKHGWEKQKNFLPELYPIDL